MFNYILTVGNQNLDSTCFFAFVYYLLFRIIKVAIFFFFLGDFAFQVKLKKVEEHGVKDFKHGRRSSKKKS